MHVEIMVDGAARETELRSLHDWLLQEPGLRSSKVSQAVPTPSPGEMGALNDVLIVALGSGGAGTVLAGALSAWLQTRVTAFSLRIRTPAGEIEMETKNLEEIEALVEQIAAVLPSQGHEPA